MNNLETRVKYLEAVCSLSAQEWGDYGWIATCNTLEEIDAVIKKRIDRVLNIDKIEQAMEMTDDE